MIQQLQTTTTTAVDDDTWQHTSHVNDLRTRSSSSRAIGIATTGTKDDSLSELEAILAKIASPDKDALDAIKQATERQTLDDKVEDAPPTRTLNLHANQFGYGNEAESYTLTLPGYKGGRDSYTVNYVSQAVEANESMTKAQYETEVNGDDCYEAALEVAERVIEEQSGGRKQTAFDLSLEEREKKDQFKFFHPQEWLMMCENATLYKLCKLMM